MRNQYVGFRLSPLEVARLDRLAELNGCTRTEAARLAFRFGIPLASTTHSFNISRVLLILEQLSASMDLIVTREHPDFADKIIDIAQERVESHHAQR